ncbi:hypothetical protein SSX86_023639 [Deinandra increscens subsp. villosa]|uniref:KIB1-4 beta-propeller domain-containing protein n=1 Tax=Deinandra increscens subsp. villosa TaxID=3103831 RepID=A0AAP0CL82_9ASTR
MKQNHICASICDRLPTLSANHPWFVDHEKFEDDTKDHVFYTTMDPLTQSRCRIPSFLGRRIRGCFYGWVILSNHPHNEMWSLWNPVTCKIIRLPRLISKVGDIFEPCCLSSPPGNHGSIFMLTTKKHTIVFCRLDCNRNKLKWVEMSYLKQMRSIVDRDGFLRSLTCCNGKVYALTMEGSNFLVLLIDIVVKGRETVISLLRYSKIPSHFLNDCMTHIAVLKGCCTELFYVELGFREVCHVTNETVGGVCVFKLDMMNMRWEEMDDLKDASFFFDPAHGYSVYYNSSSQLGGYVHFLDKSGKVIYSYDYKNRTITLSSMPTSITMSRIQKVEARFEENTESRLLNIPFDVLKTIIEFCVGVEYLNFRVACKQCHLAAPNVKWSKGGRLQTYSLNSPWLMVLHKDRGVISFTDPVFGDKYFIKTPRELVNGDLEIHCCMYGWALIKRHLGSLMFFNPFTGDIRELPYTPYLDTYCFSAPPTSSDCMVVGFTRHLVWHVYVHFVGRETSWRRFRLNFGGGGGDLHSFHFATIYRQNLYALYNNGGLDFIETDNEGYTWRKILAEGPKSSCRDVKQNFLMKRDQQLLLVILGEFGEPVEVFKLNDSIEWEKIESLGRHVIYIGGTTCLCIEAKIAAMANKIYFPRVHSENKKIVFYSLETRRYHTSNVEESFGDFMGTTHHIDPHVWIEPSWS